jgi:mono/diheme cytochrome c family protein
MRIRTVKRAVSGILVAVVAWLGLFAGAAAKLTVKTEKEDGTGLSQQAYAILKQNCVGCHGLNGASGLDLRSGAGLLKGGENGRVLVPGDPAASRLYLFVTHQEKPAMPPTGRLKEAEIETLRRWIVAGAPVDGFAPVSEEAAKAAAATLAVRPFSEEERAFWAFQPVGRPVPPTVPPGGNAAWNRHPIDAFLHARMAAKGLKPSPRADRRTLIRRVTLDVTGLLPTPAEVEEFVNDERPDAWERLVDRLLASPHYGERWARHWLDVVRYADSGGFEFDIDRPEGWRYRDYVVKSLNADKPYDHFVREQLAGDEYAPDTSEAMIATGFLRLGPDGEDKGERARQDALDDVITTTSLAFMGMTVGCARCHDHKFDPIRQADFYRIQAVFSPAQPLDYPVVPAEVVTAHKAEVARLDALLKPLKTTRRELEAPYAKLMIEEQVAKLPDYMQAAWRTPEAERTAGQKLTVQQIRKVLEIDRQAHKFSEKELIARLNPADRARHDELSARIRELEKQKPKPFPTTRAISEKGREAAPTWFLHRGSVDSRGPDMAPGTLSVLGDFRFPEPPAGAGSTWRRRGLAEWLTRRDNPLTARVMVNRLWQHHFGEGIVRTPSNFGKLGELPSHPELLDWLATEFMDRGWSLKQMHRLMLTSEAYRMKSDDTAAGLEIDPENRLFWRMARFRLEAETIRDLILDVSGNLNRTLGGPCVYPYIDPKLFQSSTKRTWPGQPDDDPATWRRSLYVYSKRSIRYPLFETFDQPNLINSCERRNRSTIAPQALLLMNNNFVLFEAGKFAERLRSEAGADVERQIERAYHLALGRVPTAFEQEKAGEFIRTTPNGLAEFCQLIFNLNEFMYRQ